MAERSKSLKTKEKILDAATTLITQKGYTATTVAEICELAEVNIASINYHFRDKKSLYINVWEKAFNHAIEKYPPCGGIDKDEPLEIRLKGWIVSTLNRALDPDCYDFEIAHSELMNPTGILTDSIASAILQMSLPLEELIKEFLGDTASDEEVQLCAMSIQSQCMNPSIFHRRIDSGLLPKPKLLDLSLDKLIEHIIYFSLGGLNEAKKRLLIINKEIKNAK